MECWEISTNHKELRLLNSECIGLDIYLKAQVLASIEFCRVLDLSASTCAMTSQFGGRISPAKLFELKSCSPIWTQACNKYLTNLVFLVCTVSYGTLFFRSDLWPVRVALRNLVHWPWTRLVRGLHLVEVLMASQVLQTSKKSWRNCNP